MSIQAANILSIGWGEGRDRGQELNNSTVVGFLFIKRGQWQRLTATVLKKDGVFSRCSTTSQGPQPQVHFPISPQSTGRD